MGLSTDERRREIVTYLSQRGYATIRELSAEFQVSYNTIQRDITALTRYHDITTSFGRSSGGVYMKQDFEPYRIYLTPRQQKLLEDLEDKLEGDDKQVMHEIIQTFAHDQSA